MAKTLTYGIDESILPHFDRYMQLHEKIVHDHFANFYKTADEFVPRIQSAWVSETKSAQELIWENFLAALETFIAYAPASVKPFHAAMPLHYALTDSTLRGFKDDQIERIKEVTKLVATRVGIWNVPLAAIDAATLSEITEAEGRLCGVFLKTLDAVKVKHDSGFHFFTALKVLCSPEKFLAWELLRQAVELEITAFFKEKLVTSYCDYNDLHESIIEGVQS